MPGEVQLSQLGGSASTPQSAAPLLPYAPKVEGSTSGSDDDDSGGDLNFPEATGDLKRQGSGAKLWTAEDGAQEQKISVREAVHCIKRVAAPFFREGGWRCWVLAVTNLIFLLAETLMMIKISSLQKEFQNAMMKRDEDKFWDTLAGFGWWVMVLMCFVFANMYAGGAFSLEWRKFLTQRLLSYYINDTQSYYKLKMTRSDLDNPDQRIGQDLGGFTGAVVPLFSHLARAVMTILSMSVVLYMVSSKLFGVLLLGSLFVSAVSVGVFGGPLMRMQRTILAREATLRFTLVRLREHAESIAFYQGANFERARCLDFFSQVIETCYRKLMVSTAFQGFNISLSVCLHFVPYIVLAPEFFAKKVEFGEIGQAAMLFNQLMHALTLLSSELEAISNLGAQAVRIRQLQEGLIEDKKRDDGDCWAAPDLGESFDPEVPRPSAIELAELPPSSSRARKKREKERQAAAAASSGGSGAVAPGFEEICLRLQSITLLPPRSQSPLVTGLSLVLREGQSLMIAGPSGVGKSSLLRAIGGLWANGHGTIERCRLQECFFAPQSPYLCMGTLRENATYPCSEKFAPSQESDELISKALKKANVGYLVQRHGLDELVSWDDVLSGGEKQRLGFARLFLRPAVRLALLDEATSAMDVENEDLAYSLLRDEVPCFASVGHHLNLEQFHSHKLTFRPQESGGCEAELEELSREQPEN